MDMVLYDICKDAIAKSATASDEERKLLVEAAAHALMLAGKARREGLLVLDKAAAASPFAPDYLRQMVSLIVDGRDPKMVLEIAAGGYWRRNPQGIHAMVYYFYIRSMLLMQEGEDPHLIQELFLSLIPDKWRDGFLKQADQERERIEQARQQQTAEIFFSMQPSFQNKELLEEIHTLEAKLLGFHAGTLQSVLGHIAMDTLEGCMYAFSEETRKKVMCNISHWRSEMLMQDIVWRGVIAEQEVLAAAKKMNAVISRLRANAEIAE